MFAALAFACGSNSGSNNGDDGDGGTGGSDDGGGGGGDGDGGIDAPPFSGMCTANDPDAPQCSNCIDDDNDMRIDGFDPECSGPLDRLEDSFATGIPGDNIDATMQDCFFDGNSGAGNDGCNQHVCCLLQAANETQCAMLAPDADESKYEIPECYKPFGMTDVPTKCQMNCGKLTPPGCDCFGCCTICDAGGCRDVITNPATSPNCNDMNITDNGPDGMDNTGDEPCKRCQKTDCGMTDCAYDGVSCTPCPGQCDANGTCNPPLPSSCGGMTTCPMGFTPCDSMGNCPIGSYCSGGCCTGAIIL
jgi:hypothetical protein